MAKLGTKKRPVRFRAQTEERLQEIALLCDKNGWKFIGGFEPDEPEDICEVQYLLNPKAFPSPPHMKTSDNMTIIHGKQKVGRNEPCPCGSGKKYKKCCIERSYVSAVENSDEFGELMWKGYSHLDENKTIEACDVWIDLWDRLKEKIRPEIVDVKEIDTIFNDGFSIYNWCQDFEIELGNAGIDNMLYYQKRIEYCSEFCKIFFKSDSLLLHNMKRAIGESYFSLNDISKGEDFFKTLIKEYPNNIWGYIGWGDMYLWPINKNIKPDYIKAEKIYNMALGKNLKDEADLIDRLNELKIEKAKNQKVI